MLRINVCKIKIGSPKLKTLIVIRYLIMLSWIISKYLVGFLTLTRQLYLFFTTIHNTTSKDRVKNNTSKRLLLKSQPIS